jgi:hypothetical protein
MAASALASFEPSTFRLFTAALPPALLVFAALPTFNTRTSASDPSSSSSSTSLSDLGLLGDICKLFLVSGLELWPVDGVLSISLRISKSSPLLTLHVLTALRAPGTSDPTPTSLSLSHSVIQQPTQPRSASSYPGMWGLLRRLVGIENVVPMAELLELIDTPLAQGFELHLCLSYFRSGKIWVSISREYTSLTSS